jgi:HrpA-like RNA helicase
VFWPHDKHVGPKCGGIPEEDWITRRKWESYWSRFVLYSGKTAFLQALHKHYIFNFVGRYLSMLPVDPKLGKMLIMGAVFRCIDPVLTVVAGLSARDPFLLPQDKKDVWLLTSIIWLYLNYEMTLFCKKYCERKQKDLNSTYMYMRTRCLLVVHLLCFVHSQDYCFHSTKKA